MPDVTTEWWIAQCPSCGESTDPIPSERVAQDRADDHNDRVGCGDARVVRYEEDDS